MSWEKEALGDLFLVGSSKRVLKSQWQTSGVPFYRGREVTKLATNGCVANELFISEELYADFEKRFGVPKAGDILITAIGTIGNAYVVQGHDRFYFKDASVLWLSKKREVESSFVNYWLQSPRFKSQLDKANGATVDTLTVKKLKSVQIDFPPLPEQKRIVAILDEAFAGIATAVANTEKNLANARELFESYLNSAFSQRGDGWSVKTVGEIADQCLGKMLDKRKNKGVPRPYLRNLNVQWFDIDITDILEMRIEDGELERYQVKHGDLLICEGGYPGRAAIWRGSDPMFFQKALHRVRCHEPVYNRWLLYYLYLADAIGELKPYFTGAGIQHFTGKALKEFRLPLAPHEEAEVIVADMEELLEETHRLESIYQKKLAALAELKQSLLQKAFSGELTAGKEVSDVIRDKEEVA